MPYVLGPGQHRVHYRVFGDPAAPPIVLIQGLSLDGRFWFEMPEDLANDAEQPWRVLVPDNRGVGKTAMPRRPWTMADMADDVAAILDAEHVPQAIVAGISMGGMIAQQVALRHSERVSGLLLMATWPGLPLARLPALQTMHDLLVPTLTGKRAVDALGRLLLPEAAQGDTEELLSGWIGLMRERPPTRGGFLGQLGAVCSHSTGHRLGRIRAPTRVVTGDEDRLVPPINSERIAARIPKAELEILPGVAHGIPLMDRDVVRRHAVELLAS